MLRPYRNIVPTIDPSAYVDESAQIVGDVTIGPETSVWLNAVVRGDVNSIRVGRQSNLQDGVIVHVNHEPSYPTVVGDQVTVGTPLISGAKVVAKVLGTTKGDKIVVFKYKNKKRYRRRTGHRQQFTSIAISQIVGQDEQKTNDQ